MFFFNSIVYLSCKTAVLVDRIFCAGHAVRVDNSNLLSRGVIDGRLPPLSCDRNNFGPGIIYVDRRLLVNFNALNPTQ